MTHTLTGLASTETITLMTLTRITQTSSVRCARIAVGSTPYTTLKPSGQLLHLLLTKDSESVLHLAVVHCTIVKL